MKHTTEATDSGIPVSVQLGPATHLGWALAPSALIYYALTGSYGRLACLLLAS